MSIATALVRVDATPSQPCLLAISTVTAPRPQETVTADAAGTRCRFVPSIVVSGSRATDRQRSLARYIRAMTTFTEVWRAYIPLLRDVALATAAAVRPPQGLLDRQEAERTTTPWTEELREVYSLHDGVDVPGIVGADTRSPASSRGSAASARYGPPPTDPPATPDISTPSSSVRSVANPTRTPAGCSPTSTPPPPDPPAPVWGRHHHRCRAALPEQV